MYTKLPPMGYLGAVMYSSCKRQPNTAFVKHNVRFIRVEGPALVELRTTSEMALRSGRQCLRHSPALHACTTNRNRPQPSELEATRLELTEKAEDGLRQELIPGRYWEGLIPLSGKTKMKRQGGCARVGYVRREARRDYNPGRGQSNLSSLQKTEALECGRKNVTETGFMENGGRVLSVWGCARNS